MQELEVAKKKLAELTGTDGENITAKVAGTVTSVECNAGDKKMKDDVLCTIEVPDQGYTLSFTATNEQASRLRIGDQATVSNFYQQHQDRPQEPAEQQAADLRPGGQRDLRFPADHLGRLEERQL